MPKQHDATPLRTVENAQQLSYFIVSHKKGKGQPTYAAIRADFSNHKNRLCNLGRLSMLTPEPVELPSIAPATEELADQLLSPLCNLKSGHHSYHGVWYAKGMAWLTGYEDGVIIGIKTGGEREGCWRANQRLDTINPSQWNGSFQDPDEHVKPAIDSVVIGEFKVGELLALLKPMLKFQTVLGDGWSNIVLIGHEFFEVDQVFKLLTVASHLTDTVTITSFPRFIEKKPYWSLSHESKPGGLLFRDKQGLVIRVTGIKKRAGLAGDWQTHHCLLDIQPKQSPDLIDLANTATTADRLQRELKSVHLSVDNQVKSATQAMDKALHILADHAETVAGIPENLPPLSTWGATALETLQAFERNYRQANLSSKEEEVKAAVLSLQAETGRVLPDYQPLIQWLEEGMRILNDLAVHCEEYRPE